MGDNWGTALGGKWSSCHGILIRPRESVRISLTFELLSSFFACELSLAHALLSWDVARWGLYRGSTMLFGLSISKAVSQTHALLFFIKFLSSSVSLQQHKTDQHPLLHNWQPIIITRQYSFPIITLHYSFTGVPNICSTGLSYQVHSLPFKQCGGNEIWL